MCDDADEGVGVVAGGDIADLHGEPIAGEFCFGIGLLAETIDEWVEPVEDDAEFGEPIPPEVAAFEVSQFVEEDAAKFSGFEMGDDGSGENDGGTQTSANEG